MMKKENVKYYRALHSREKNRREDLLSRYRNIEDSKELTNKVKIKLQSHVEYEIEELELQIDKEVERYESMFKDYDEERDIIFLFHRATYINNYLVRGQFVTPNIINIFDTDNIITTTINYYNDIEELTYNNKKYLKQITNKYINRIINTITHESIHYTMKKLNLRFEGNYKYLTLLEHETLTRILTYLTHNDVDDDKLNKYVISMCKFIKEHYGGDD